MTGWSGLSGRGKLVSCDAPAPGSVCALESAPLLTSRGVGCRLWQGSAPSSSAGAAAGAALGEADWACLCIAVLWRSNVSAACFAGFSDLPQNCQLPTIMLIPGPDAMVSHLQFRLLRSQDPIAASQVQRYRIDWGCSMHLLHPELRG